MINLDFADVRAIMKDAGPAWMSIGKGSGENRAVDAAQAALAVRYWMYPCPEPKLYCF